MKYLYIIIALLIGSNVLAFDPPSCGDPWYYQNDNHPTFWVPDKAQHYWGSYLLNTTISQHVDKKVSTVATLALGFLWEVKDSQTSLGKGKVGFSYRDLIADGLGVVSAVINTGSTWKMYVDYSTVDETITFNVLRKL